MHFLGVGWNQLSSLSGGRESPCPLRSRSLTLLDVLSEYCTTKKKQKKRNNPSMMPKSLGRDGSDPEIKHIQSHLIPHVLEVS
jgi:hypothetical protein